MSSRRRAIFSAARWSPESIPRGAYEANNIHLEGDRAVRKTLTVKGLRVMIPESVGGNMLHITAEEARFHPSPGDPPRGKWELTGCTPRNLAAIPGIQSISVISGRRAKMAGSPTTARGAARCR